MASQPIFLPNMEDVAKKTTDYLQKAEVFLGFARGPGAISLTQCVTAAREVGPRINELHKAWEDSKDKITEAKALGERLRAENSEVKSTNHALTNEMAEYRSERETLITEVKQLKVEREPLMKAAEQAKKDIGKANKNLEKVMTAQADLKAREELLTQTKQTVDQNATKVLQRETSVKAQENLANQLSLQVIAQDTEVSKRQRDIMKVLVEISSSLTLSVDVARVYNDSDYASTLVEPAKEALKKLLNESIESSQKVTSLSDQCSTLQAQLSTTEEGHTSAKQTLIDERDALKEKLTQSLITSQISETKCTQAFKETSDAKSERSTAVKASDDARIKLENIQDKVKDLEAELVRLRPLETKLSDTKAELASKSTALSRETSKLRSQTDAKEKLQNKVESLQEELTRARAELEDLKSIKSDKEEAEEKLKAALTKMETLRGDKISAELLAYKNGSEAERLKESTAKFRETESELRDQIARYVEEISRLKADVSHKDDSLSQEASDKASMTAKAERLEGEVEQLNVSIETLRRERSEASRESAESHDLSVKEHLEHQKTIKTLGERDLELARLTESRDAYRVEARQLRQQHTAASQEVTRLRNEVNSQPFEPDRNSAIVQWEENAKETSAIIDSLNQTIRMWQTRYDEREAKLQRMHADLTTAKLTVAKNELKLVDLGTQVKAYQSKEKIAQRSEDYALENATTTANEWKARYFKLVDSNYKSHDASRRAQDDNEDDRSDEDLTTSADRPSLHPTRGQATASRPSAQEHNNNLLRAGFEGIDARRKGNDQGLQDVDTRMSGQGRVQVRRPVPSQQFAGGLFDMRIPSDRLRISRTYKTSKQSSGLVMRAPSDQAFTSRRSLQQSLLSDVPAPSDRDEGSMQPRRNSPELGDSQEIELDEGTLQGPGEADHNGSVVAVSQSIQDTERQAPPLQQPSISTEKVDKRPVSALS